MKRGLIALPVASLMIAFGVIQWFNLVEGGSGFTVTDAQKTFWSLSHIALMVFAAMCVMVLTVAHGATKFWLSLALAGLAVVQITGAYLGRSSIAMTSDTKQSAAIQHAAALERKAADIRSATLPAVSGLSGLAASADGRASRDRLDSARNELKTAGDLDAQAAQIRAQAGVSATQIGGGLLDAFLFGMTLCIELGFAICAHFLARIFCNDFESIFNNLQHVASRKTSAEPDAKK